VDVLKDVFPLLAQIGVMIWWASRINAKVESINATVTSNKEALDTHIEEDKEMQKQIQAMAVNEANVGGMLSNLALEIRYIRQSLDERTEDHGELLELKLEKQSSELILKFGDMLQTAKAEFGKEAARMTANQIDDALRKLRSSGRLNG
jgi:hypothetical protein